MNDCREIDTGRGRESFFPVGRAMVSCMDRGFFGRQEKKTPDPLGPATAGKHDSNSFADLKRSLAALASASMQTDERQF